MSTQFNRTQICKVYVAMPQNWTQKNNVMKRALGAIQRAHPNLAIYGVNNPSEAHAHYFVDTSGPNWMLKKAFKLDQVESIPLNQGSQTDLSFITPQDEAKENRKIQDMEAMQQRFEEPAK